MFERTQFMADDDEAGIAIADLGRALVTWTAMQDRTPTIAEAAMAFNTAPEIIREAVADAMWIYINDHNQTLELDGA